MDKQDKAEGFAQFYSGCRKLHLYSNSQSAVLKLQAYTFKNTLIHIIAEILLVSLRMVVLQKAGKFCNNLGQYRTDSKRSFFLERILKGHSFSYSSLSK